MISTSSDGITAVVDSIGKSRFKVFEEMDNELAHYSTELVAAFEAIKLKISESSGIRKKAKLTPISENDENGENINPNIITAPSNKSDEMLSYDDIEMMKVTDLKEELGKRGLSVFGLKKDLKERLISAIAENSRKSDDHNKDMTDQHANLNIINESSKLKSMSGSLIQKQPTFDDEVELKSIASEMEVDVHEIVQNKFEQTDMNVDSDEIETKQGPIAIETNISSNEIYDVQKENDSSEANKSPRKEGLGKKILKILSPKSPKSSKFDEKASSTTSSEDCQKIGASIEEGIQKGVRSNRNSIVCNMTIDQIEKAEKKNNTESSLFVSKSITEEKPNKSSSESQNSSVSSSNNKLKSIQEARKARLAEIRGKAKVQASSSADIVATKLGAGGQDTDRQKALAQMRQKVADATLKENEQKAHQTPKNHLKDSAMKKIQAKALSPMDTYEMSDKDGSSDSDDYDSEHDKNKPKKRIPKWAQRSQLIPALEKQYLDGPDKIDPDTIFHEISTCDLEAIFGQKKKRYAKRTSSGNWTKDKSTIEEKLVYKRAMGYMK